MTERADYVWDLESAHEIIDELKGCLVRALIDRYGHLHYIPDLSVFFFKDDQRFRLGINAEFLSHVINALGRYISQDKPIISNYNIDFIGVLWKLPKDYLLPEEFCYHGLEICIYEPESGFDFLYDTQTDKVFINYFAREDDSLIDGFIIELARIIGRKFAKELEPLIRDAFDLIANLINEAERKLEICSFKKREITLEDH